MEQFDTHLHHVQHGLSTVELVHTPSSVWPLSPTSSASHPTLRIAVLDSSFNPPTLAHHALASAPPPLSQGDTEESYDAHLLLLSVRNADKKLKSGDASYAQRMEMMILLAREVVDANVAVAIIDEPTFVGKSMALLTFLQVQLRALPDHSFQTLDTPGSSQSPITPIPQKLQLTFLQGMDTLERLLNPLYYGSEERMRSALTKFFSADGDDSRVVCARRTMHDTQSHGDGGMEKERQVLKPVKQLLDSRKVMLIDIGEDVRSFSSSDVRAKIARGDETWKGMVTKEVAQYIVEQKLYLDSPI